MTTPPAGYYLMHRGWMGNAVFGRDGRLCRRAAWVWLIERAQWAEGEVVVDGKPVTLRRGQLLLSQRYAAEAWGWDRSAVRRFLAALVANSMVKIEVSTRPTIRPTIRPTPPTETDPGDTVITLCNYDVYQGCIIAPDPQPDATRPTTRPTTRPKTKEKKEIHPSDESPTDIAGVRASVRASEGRRRPQRLPDGWRPSPAAWEFACQSIPDPERHLAEFTSYWQATGRPMADWDACWRNRVLKVAGVMADRAAAQRASLPRSDQRSAAERRNDQLADSMRDNPYRVRRDDPPLSDAPPTLDGVAE